jgi:O-antigen ligase
MLVLTCRSEALRRTLGGWVTRHVWVVAILAVVALYGVGRTYIAATEAGLLGEEARSRLQMQTLDAADPVVGLIGGGRGEFFASVRAIADSPVIGHGSWARSAEYYGIYVDSLRRMGSEYMAMLAEYVGRRDGHVLPTHSHVLGAWVEAGLAGAAFWLLVAVTLVRAGVRALPNPTALGIVILCALPAQMWALAFSPLGADSRLFWALLLVSCCRILAADERPRPTGLFAQP